MKAAPWIFAHYQKIYNLCPILIKLGENDQPMRWSFSPSFIKNWAKSIDFLIQLAKIKSAGFIWEIGFRTIPKWYYLLQPRNITKVQFRSTAFIRRIKDSLKKYWLLFEKRNLFGFPAHNRAKLYVMAKVIITVVLKTALFVQRNIEMKFPFPPPEQMAILD